MFKSVHLTVLILTIARCVQTSSLKLNKTPNNFVKCTCTDGSNLEKTPSGSLISTPGEIKFDLFNSPLHPEFQKIRFPNFPQSCSTPNEVQHNNFPSIFPGRSYPMPNGVHSIGNNFPRHNGIFPGFGQNEVHHNFPQTTWAFPGRNYPMGEYSLEKYLPEKEDILSGPMKVQHQNFPETNLAFPGKSYLTDVQSIKFNFPHKEDIFLGYPFGHQKFPQVNWKIPGGTNPMPMNIQSIKNFPFRQNKVQNHNFPHINLKFPGENDPMSMKVYTPENYFPKNILPGQNRVEHQNFPETNWKHPEGSHPMLMDIHYIEKYLPKQEDISPGFGPNKILHKIFRNFNWKFPEGSTPTENHFPQNDYIYPGIPFGQNGYEITFSQIPGQDNYASPNPFNLGQSVFQVEEPNIPYFPDLNHMNFPTFDNSLSGVTPKEGKKFWHTVSRLPYYIPGMNNIKYSSPKESYWPIESKPLDMVIKPHGVIKIPWVNNGQFSQPQGDDIMRKSETKSKNKTPSETSPNSKSSSTTPMPNANPENNLKQTKTPGINSNPTTKPAGSTNPKNMDSASRKYEIGGNLNPTQINLKAPLASTNSEGFPSPGYVLPFSGGTAGFVNPRNPGYLPNKSSLTSTNSGGPSVPVNSEFSIPSLKDDPNLIPLSPGIGIPAVTGYTESTEFSNSVIISTEVPSISLAASSNPVNPKGNLPTLNGFRKSTPFDLVDMNTEYGLPDFSGSASQDLNPIFDSSLFSGVSKVEEPFNPSFSSYSLGYSNPVNTWYGPPSFSGYTNKAGPSNPLNLNPEGFIPIKIGSSSNTNVNFNTNLAESSNPVSANSEFSLPSTNSGLSYSENVNSEYGFPSFNSYLEGYSFPVNLGPWLGLPSYSGSSPSRKINKDDSSINTNINTNTNTNSPSNDVNLESLNPIASNPNINFGLGSAGSFFPPNLNSGNFNPAFGLPGGNLAGSLIPNNVDSSSTNTNTNINSNTNLGRSSNSLNLNPAIGLSSNPLNLNREFGLPSANLVGSSVPNIFSAISPSGSSNLAGSSNLNPSFGLPSGNLGGLLVPNKLGSSSANINTNINTNTNTNPVNLNRGFDLQKSSISSKGSINPVSLLSNINMGSPPTSSSGLSGNLGGSLISKISTITPTVNTAKLNTGINLKGSLNPSPLNVNLGIGNLGEIPKLGSSTNVNVNTNSNSNSGIDLLKTTRSLISNAAESASGTSETAGEIPNLLNGLNLNFLKNGKEKLPDLSGGLKLVTNAVSSAVGSGINPDSKSNGLLGGLGFF